MPEVHPAVRRAGCWFLRSGIQEPDGGVARYYLVHEGRNAAVSTEITGYAVSALVYIAGKTGEARFLDAALRAARFLTQAWDREIEAMPFETARSNGTRPPSYFFDCGIIVRGLLAAWRATAAEDLLEIAVKCGRAMARDFVENGVAHPILTLPEKKPSPWEPRWSRRPGCYQLKSAMAWKDLEEATGSAEWAVYYEEAVRSALGGHSEFLPGSEDQEKVMDRLHAYCYFLEGLLPVANRADVRGALDSGIARTGELLRRIAPVFARSDVYAQLLRVRLYAHALGNVALDEGAAREEAKALAQFHCDSGEPRLKDGFWFGVKQGAELPFMNPVSTAFAMQALESWHEHSDGEFRARRADLI